MYIQGKTKKLNQMFFLKEAPNVGEVKCTYVRTFSSFDQNKFQMYTW